MKKILFFLIFAGVLSSLLILTSSAADFKEADELFEKGTFQAALDGYDQIAENSKDAHEVFKAFFRGCESLTNLYRYGEAVERIRNYKGRLLGHDRHLFLALKAEILRNFLIQYGAYQRNDVLDIPGKEAFRLTPKEVREEITKAYAQLWESRRELVKLPLKDEDYFLDLKKVDFGLYPTFLDYVVQSWLGAILQSVNDPDDTKKNPEALPLLADTFQQPFELNDPPGLVAAELIETLVGEHGSEDIEAQERWKIQRLLLPVQRPDLFIYPKDKKPTDYGPLAKDVLLRWVDMFQNPEARAEALFEAASLAMVEFLSKDKQPLKQAHDLCRRIETEFGSTKMKARAQQMRQAIEMPQMYLQPKPDSNPGHNKYFMTSKNVKDVYFKLYPFDFNKAMSLDDNQNRFRRGLNGLFNHYPYPPWVKEIAGTQVPLKTWQQNTKDSGIYETLNNDVNLPKLNKGLYLLLASANQGFTFGSSLLSAVIINVTDLVLMATTGPTEKTLAAYYDMVENGNLSTVDDEISRFYTVNARTGEPVADAVIDIDPLNNNNNREQTQLKTDNLGMAAFPLTINLGPNNNNFIQFDVSANKDNSFAFFAQPIYFNYSSVSPYQLYLETDRPIYRPGDKVQAKVIAIKHISSGFKVANDQHTVKVSARDTNGKEFFTQERSLNDFGSASFAFEIPSGRLLGQYGLLADYNDGRFSAQANAGFSVEEYKRPEFELTFKDAQKLWKYNEPVEIQGNAKYYFGGAVPNAPVSYKIHRQWYVPYYFRYWFGRNYSFDNGGNEIASGQVTTDKDGKFTIAFTPIPAENNSYSGQMPDISAYDVEVDGRDAGGRTIHASHSFRAGKNALYFEITPRKGFFFGDTPIKIDARELTMNDEPLEGRANYEVYALSSDAVKPAFSNGNWQNFPVLQIQLKDVKNGYLAGSGQVDYDKEGKATIDLPSLPQGSYRIVIKTNDAWGQEVRQEQIFVVAKDTKKAVPLGAYSVTIPEQQEYEVGQTARFLIGSSLGFGVYFLEIWTGEYLHERRLIDSILPVQVIEIPITEALKGGFTLRWFGVKDHVVWHGQESVSVPWKEKKLSVEFDPFGPELMPGTDISWGIKVLDKDKKPVSAEVLALMYDRSLDYYFSSDYPWLDGLYSPRSLQEFNYGFDSVWQMNAFQIPVTEGLLQRTLGLFQQPPEEFRLPGLRTWQTWAGGRGGFLAEGLSLGWGSRQQVQGRLKAASDDLNEQFAPSNVAGMVASDSASSRMRGGYQSSSYNAVDKKSLSDGALPVAVRKEFADTAFFKPALLTTSDGKGSFTFKVPEQLTSWKVKAFAFTKDVKEGTVVREAVTRKDLMVRVDIPRFFREKDKGTITAFVHNEGTEPFKGQLTISVTENGENIDQKIKLTDTTREFDVNPHAQKSFDWLIEIPHGVTTYKVRAQAKAGQLSDAEERLLPILPSRERLMESRFVSLAGNMKKDLQIKLADDPTRINETMNLQVDPQLFLTVMNTIPFLVEYPFECVEQILNKYVPLSIMSQVYRKHPEIQRAVGKIPKRSTSVPAWEKDDPNRLMKLMETPWVWESEGRATINHSIDMLQPEVVNAKEAQSLEKLRSAQLPNGAFPWWAGGQADPYMTLYVLDGFAQARRYGVNVPRDMIERALAYVNNEIPLRLKPEAYELSLMSMAAFVVTSYPENEFPAARKGFEAARAWVKFLETNIHALTQFGKAYLAYTYLHLGDTKRANEVLDMAMDGSREDPIAGVYWAPEKYSWVWYSDTVEMHAFLLRTLQELRPDDKRIDGMVQWLLFNRKGNVWKSTKASVAAVFALLDYMDKKGSLVSDENFKIQWGKTNDELTVAADDWLEKPLRWQKQGFEIQPPDNTATVTKDGPGVTFASLNWTYSTDQIPQASEPGMLELARTFYLRVKEGEDYHLKPLTSGSSVSVGDEIEVQLKINTRSQFEYVYLKDPKAAGFEAETLLSGWKYDPLSFYEEPRDSLSNFFMSWVPQGEYILRYRLRPTKPGTYRIGAATLQPMYASEMSAHSDGFVINVGGQ